MSWSDLHTHTDFSDGYCTAEEMVIAAIEKGMDALGFSEHSYTDFDDLFCTPAEKLVPYREEITRLQKKYAGKLRILFGIEQDFFSTTSTEGYDYTIGSVHYVKADGAYIPMDYTAKHITDGADQYFDGDVYAVLEAYFQTVGEFAARKDISIVGHFDVPSKFNENDLFFDSSHPRYVAAWKAAADRLIAAGIPFEINTGAIARGYRTAPYPHPVIMDYIRDHGGKFILSSDAHTPDKLCWDFENWAHYL